MQELARNRPLSPMDLSEAFFRLPRRACGQPGIICKDEGPELGRHQAVESGGSLYDAMARAVIPALAPATALSRMRSNAQREQLNHAYSDQQHHERHGIVIQPVSVLCAHDIPLVRFFSRSVGAKG